MEPYWIRSLGSSQFRCMDLLGHSQIGLTMNTYSHVIPAMQNEAANRMDEILTPVAVKEEKQTVN